MWKDIDFQGYEEFKGLYAINENGDIKNLKTGKILSPAINNKGYKCVVLYNNYKSKHLQIHRGVALAFIPNANNYPIVMHIDNNPLNCHVSNLKWGTQKDNMRQCVNDNRFSFPKPRQKVYELYNPETNKPIKYYIGSEQASKDIGCTQSSLWCAVCNNSTFRFGKFKGNKIRVSTLEKPFTIGI